MTTDPIAPAESARQPVVKFVNGEAVADSRDVASYFGKQHKDVLRALRELHCSEDFRRRNFTPFIVNDLTGETTSHVMMTKNGFAFVAMGFTGASAGRFKEAYILQFDAMEAELRSRPAIDPMEALNDPVAMRGLLLTYAEKTLALQAENARLAVKADRLDKIAESDGSFSLTAAAKLLQVRPKDLFRYLSSNGWMYRRPGAGHWLGYSARTISGDLEHKVTTVLRADGTEKTVEQLRVTCRGLTKLALLIQGRMTTGDGRAGGGSNVVQMPSG